MQHSAKLMELKEKVKKLTSCKRYEEAEVIYLQVQQMEKEENEIQNDSLEEQIERQESLLRQR